MTEFCDLDTFRIVLGDEHEERSYTLTELLPLTFEGMSK